MFLLSVFLVGYIKVEQSLGAQVQPEEMAGGVFFVVLAARLIVGGMLMPMPVSGEDFKIIDSHSEDNFALKVSKNVILLSRFRPLGLCCFREC